MDPEISAGEPDNGRIVQVEAEGKELKMETGAAEIYRV